MTDKTLPQKTKRSTNFFQQRISYCVKVFRIILSLSGIILVIVQVVKAILSALDGDNISLSVILTSILGILFFVASFPPYLEKIIARLATRIRYRSFRTYTYIFPILLTILILWGKVKIGATSAEWGLVSSEGGLSEYGTAIAYLLTAIFAYPIATQFWRQRKKLMAGLYFLLTLTSVFISMEEISWGQRLIGFEEPKFWVEHNAQSEFTFHNLSFFQEHLLDQGFLSIGFLGSFSWIVLHYWLRRRQKSSAVDWSYILPSLSISSFFYPTFIFFLIHLYTDKFGFFITEDQEHCEFIMSLGILLFIIINFFRQVKERKA